MTTDFVVGFGRQAIEVTLMLALPMLGLGLIVGLAVSIFQATTQIQEMTLTFIPKILAIMVALVVFSPWMLEKLVNFTQQVIVNVPNYVR
ncbi:MAG: flagellar biosynthesis protein FliQ [Thermodesulfobacteriota bacterium]